MWGLAIASEYKYHRSNMDAIVKTKEANTRLEEENKRLHEELEFYKSISNFPNSLVSNMFVKIKDGKNVWIDRQNILSDKVLLNQLEKDQDVIRWLDDINVKYKDSDW